VAQTGFRLDTEPYKRRLALVREHLVAEYFWPDLLEFARKSINRCIKNTDTRDFQTIKRNQGAEYDKRVNYIPTVHSSDGDRLVVARDGTHWLNVQGKWYNASLWLLPQQVNSVYNQLNGERLRRLGTNKSDFIQRRAQARFLYKKSWVEVGEALGVDVRASESVQKSLTRRVPAKNPPKGYAIRHGAKDVISIDIRNPFASTTTAFHDGNGARLLSDALEQQRKPFNDAVERKLKRAIFAILKEHGGA
jgi:hypothetical protein